jgi:MFS family permease
MTILLTSANSSPDLGQATTEKLYIDIDNRYGAPQYTTDRSLIDWDGTEDPQNPMNWTRKAKIINCGTIIFLVTLTPLVSSMFAPGVPDILREFKVNSDTLAAFVVLVYLLGFAISPLLISPLSEIYGRRPIYTVCNVGFIAFTIACAVASSIPQLIVFRFLAGCFGVSPITLRGASIADMFAQESRGAAMAAYSLGPLLGPIIGPIASGYLAAAEGWR